MSGMIYNTCETCGANNGRAGMLWGKITESGADLKECKNCHETRKRGEVFIDLSLNRTDDEIQKTMNILSV